MHRVGYCTPNIHYHPESMTFGNRVLEDVITDEVILDDSWPYSTPNSAVLLGKKKKKKETETVTQGAHQVKTEVKFGVLRLRLLVITRS